MPEASVFINLPESVQNLLRHGIGMLRPKKVILFGSRARGDFRPESDYDFVFKENSRPESWSSFMLDYEDKPLTLYKVDLLEYEKCSKEYKLNIDREGILVYED